MEERTENAAWLVEAPDGTEVYSQATGEFHVLDDAWFTSRYDETVDFNDPCVEVHTQGDAWTCSLDEDVQVRVP